MKEYYITLRLRRNISQFSLSRIHRYYYGFRVKADNKSEARKKAVDGINQLDGTGRYFAVDYICEI